MRDPAAPLLQLGFYFGDRADADAFADLTEAVITLGGQPVEEVEVYVGDGIRTRTSFRLLDEAPSVMRADRNHLHGLLFDPDIRVNRVAFSKVIGLAPKALEVLT